jgi:hypothetical protein
MKTFTIMLSAIAFIFFAGICRAQEEPVKPAEAEVKAQPAEAASEAKPAPEPKKKLKEPLRSNGDVQEVQGEVSAITKNSISIVSERKAETGEETEMVFTFDPKKINLEHRKSLAGIAPGDTVAVRYRDETTDYGDKQETKVSAVTIRFIKPADDQSEYKKPSAPETGLTSDELSLKGVK